MTKLLQHHMFRHSRLLRNRRGYSGIIAAIFIVLVVLFLYFNVYTFIVDRNTALQDTQSIVSQMETERNSEQLELRDVNYAVSVNHMTVTVSGTIQNIGSVAVSIARMWVQAVQIVQWQGVTVVERGTSGPESSNLFPTTLQPGQQSPFPQVSVSMSGAVDPDNFNFTVWFVTARGNSFSVKPTTVPVSISGFLKTFGDFIPDYHSVQWNILNTATGKVDPARWNDGTGWVIPRSTSTNPIRIIWRINMTYIGEEPITIANNTMLYFVPYSGKTVSQWTPFSTYVVNCDDSGRISTYSKNPKLVEPSLVGTPLTLYFGSYLIGINPPSGFPTFWGDYSPIPENYFCPDAVGAMMSLTIYGRPPESKYAQSFPLFAISNQGQVYQVTFSTNPNNAGITTPSGTILIPPTTIDISATPDSTHTFSHWTTTGSISIADSNAPTTKATINGAGTITANFNRK